jgi:CRP-like cAMP-binding protein
MAWLAHSAARDGGVRRLVVYCAQLFPLLKPLSASPKEVIFHRGDRADLFYFLVKGKVECVTDTVYRPTWHTPPPHSSVYPYTLLTVACALCALQTPPRTHYRIGHGQHFGESVLTGRRREATHRAITLCEMYAISREDLLWLFEREPREAAHILDEVQKAYKHREQLRCERRPPARACRRQCRAMARP